MDFLLMVGAIVVGVILVGLNIWLDDSKVEEDGWPDDNEM